uniref:Secreted protein n=1 Tax=Panagrellus redivivus TaxID=6233 RepID=A0A7E4VUM9_PANRE
MRITSIFLPLLAALSALAKPQSDKVWDVQALSSSEHRPLSRSPNYLNSKPTKIRLVNYEQRQLAQRQQESSKGKNGSSYLGMVRQKMRGAPTQVINTGVHQTGVLTEIGAASEPEATTTTTTAAPTTTTTTTVKPSMTLEKLPEFDSLHKARELFDMRKDGSPIAPVSELEIKDDHQLFKSMQRTTVKMREYPSQDGIDGNTNDSEAGSFDTTTPLPSTASSNAASVEMVTPVLPVGNTIPAFMTLPGFTAPTFPPIPSQANLTGGLPPYLPVGVGIAHASSTTAPQFEQLGCNWDILSNTCKDVFALGWCLGCEDFGNVFLHDCRCTAPAPKPNATSTLPPATSYGGSLGGPPQPPPVPEHRASGAPTAQVPGAGFLQQNNRFFGFV